MPILVVAIHVIVCFALILIVLLQTGKGADIGAAFGGGSSQTLFGSSGAGNLLTKATTIAAIVFMCTSLALAYYSGRRGQRSVMREAPVSQEAPALPASSPAAPLLPPAAGNAGGVVPKAPATGAPVPVAPVSVPLASNNAAAPASSLPQGVKVEATSTAKVTIPATGGTAQPVKVTIPATAPAAVPAAQPAPAPASGETEAPAETK